MRKVWESFSEPVRLIHTNRKVLAVNEIAASRGMEVSVFQSRTKRVKSLLFRGCAKEFYNTIHKQQQVIELIFNDINHDLQIHALVLVN